MIGGIIWRKETGNSIFRCLAGRGSQFAQQGNDCGVGCRRRSGSPTAAAASATCGCGRRNAERDIQRRSAAGVLEVQFGASLHQEADEWRAAIEGLMQE